MNDVIRGNFRLPFFFFYDKILQAQTKIKKTSKEKVTHSLIYVLYVHKKHLRRRKSLV